MFRNEVERLVILGVLEIGHDSDWVSPSFAQPKPKSNRVRFLSYFRNLNKQFKRNPYPMSEINKILFKLEGFQHDMPLDLNTVYYNI